MRHRRRGRKLGRNPKHQRALLRNLASSLILTERDAELDRNAPKVPGRIVTTLPKAKEVRPLVEKCVTVACHSLESQQRAEQLATSADRHSEKWRQWRTGDGWRRWTQAVAPSVAARRRVLRLLGNPEAVRVLFDDIAPRFADRDGGYTRILRLAKPRLGDAGTRAILEFVGLRDRVTQKSQRPAFEAADEPPEQDARTVQAMTSTGEPSAGDR
jgi:large subunit ribosomal protein L17